MAQGQQEQVDSNLRILYAAVVLVIIILLSWFFGKEYIVRTVFFLRRMEIDLLFAALMPISHLLHFLHLPSFSLSSLYQWQSYLTSPALSPSDVSLATVGTVSQTVGRYLSFPFAIILIGMSAFMYYKHKGLRFVKVYNMKSLRAAEVSNWPQITPIVKLNLVKQDINKGPWAMSQTPLEFGEKHNLVYPKKEKGVMGWSLDHGAAAREFTMQLGQRWIDPEKLPIHVQALFVVFVACANKQRNVADDLLKQIARSARTTGQLDFTGVSELVKKYKKSSVVKWASSRHSYVLTIMATLITAARTIGVVATADFLWLKPVDRRLWYMLNSVGRQTVVTEVAGPFAHWLAEKRVGRSLAAPMVKEAVIAMEVAITETLYVAEGD